MKNKNMKYKILYLLLFLTLIGINSNALAQVPEITIESKVNTDNSVLFTYKKQVPGSFYLYIDFSNASNFDTVDYRGVIRGYSGDLLTLRPLIEKQSIGYSYRYYTIFGEPNPKVDSLFYYVLPFKKGNRHQISEASYLGEIYFDQERPKNWKSYVINLETADTICSMRKGIVVKVDNQYQNSSLEMVYTSNRNSINVEHSDGTIAVYTGFKKNGLFVKLGQTVYPQTELGVMEQFNANNYRLDFSISFLFDKNIKSIEEQTLQNYKSEYEFVTPYFVTENGIEKLVSNKEYSSVCSETELFNEFSRSEKKKYLKDPNKFK
jgi:hypothetical protein